MAELSGQHGYPAKVADVHRRLRFFLKNGDHSVYVAQIPNGVVVGWVHVEIGGLVVAEDFRGRGADERLLDRAERWAVRKRMNSVYFRSNILRNESHKFYQKRGYWIIKTQCAFLKHL